MILLATYSTVSADGPESTLPIWVALLILMSFVPFLLTMTTSFAKIVIVGGILRQAIGTQQTPPTAVITGLALILTLHIMAPVAEEVRVQLENAGEGVEPTEVVAAIEEPMRDFLERHADESNVAFFRDMRARQSEGADPADSDSPLASVMETLTVYGPAFALTELTEAFQIGFLLFVPFLMIDLIVGNILQALGMMMLSPLAVSLPFKLLLFVTVDGWRVILQGVVLGYAS